MSIHPYKNKKDKDLDLEPFQFKGNLPSNANSEVCRKPICQLDGFRGFIESMVEEIILKDMPFDSYKEELKKRCEAQGVDYDGLEYHLEVFLEDLDLGIKTPDGLASAMAIASVLRDAEKCYVREEKIEEICDIWRECHPNQEFHPHHPK